MVILRAIRRRCCDRNFQLFSANGCYCSWYYRCRRDLFRKKGTRTRDSLGLGLRSFRAEYGIKPGREKDKTSRRNSRGSKHLLQGDRPGKSAVVCSFSSCVSAFSAENRFGIKRRSSQLEKRNSLTGTRVYIDHFHSALKRKKMFNLYFNSHTRINTYVYADNGASVQCGCRDEEDLPRVMKQL